MTSPILRSPINSDLANVTPPLLDVSTPGKMKSYRQSLEPVFTVENTIRGKEDVISYKELDIPGPAGPMRATIFRPKRQTRPVEETPGILHIHGGGLATGNRFLGFTMLDWIESLGAVCLTAEYRLAPEHHQPAPLEDSYAALQWMSDHAAELGFNPRKLVVCGGSAGGNLAAGVTLLARDRSGPQIRGQVLMYPWVDDGMEYVSMRQYADIAPLREVDVAVIANYAFGEGREYADMYTAPMRAKNFAGLPPTFIDVGEADVFRDQDIAYASALWKDGVSTELHVWPGSWHGFDVFVPDAPISRRARAARLEWLQKLLNSPDGI
ncbi:carboxylesterase NlhH [Aspergillus udagawae]|uniref:Carboxylesterase NlhH n=1 Tax=Aspergillus udagawae TaxID=91492 RepID=A0ABQ1BA88_9EURO|nr:carboxylesterase NlhH [Aspergillus udagawae]GFF97252.1 carboxylesterase NlhH [Aspergillus udagawae]